jgi:soluble lytic murein transglycosylase-like protein
MNGTVLKKHIRTTLAVIIHFAHGGLLAAGFLVALLLVTFAGSAQGHPRGLLALGELIAEGRSVKAADSVAAAEVILPSREVRTMVDYLSRRYRVAAAAVEPLVLTAQEAGVRTGLDPVLLVAVMAIESGFNPIAESPMGAQGLMQVIPRFHQDKIDAVPGDDLLDPAVNIHVGALVLKECVLRAGSLEAGLQQYAGAVSDSEGLYAAKVLAEKQRIETVLRRARQSSV